MSSHEPRIPSISRTAAAGRPRAEARESLELEEFGRKLLRDQFERLSRLMAREDWVPSPVKAGSKLDLDRLATDYDPISDQAVFFVAVAADHLFTFKEVVEGKEKLPVMAGFTLMRASVGNSARGIYLLAPALAQNGCSSL
jgi:hypothetical protein